MVWTHAGAYLARADKFRIRGACDPVAENVRRFQHRCPDAAAFADVDAMLAATRPTIVSVCTPVETHADVLDRVLDDENVRLIWCEKPLAQDLRQAERITRKAAQRGVRVLVSYVRRWTPLWRKARALVYEGGLGAIRCVRIAAPNRLLSVGSHAIDLALLFGGEAVGVRSLPLPSLEQDGEPAVAALIAFANSGYGVVQVAGLREALMVEAEIIGDDGRLWVREDRGEIRLERFVNSARYAGYRELAEATLYHEMTQAEMSPFVAIADELATLAGDATQLPSCDATSALAVQRILEDMGAEARAA